MKLGSLLSVPRTTGDLGIEIECCGSDLPHGVYGWRTESDGSLHGNGVEYVLESPKSLSGVGDALEELNDAFAESDTVYRESHKAGVHVHVNVQELNVVELANFIVAYLCFEDVLVELCGKERVGNLFCLRTRDAEWHLSAIKSMFVDKSFGPLRTDDLRYSSMNMKALSQYGSVEFRAMRSTDDFQLIYQWANLLLNLRDNAKGFHSPTSIIEGTSQMMVSELADHLFGDLSHLVKAVSGYEEKVMDCMRNFGQEVAYCVDWSSHFTRHTTTDNNPFAKAKQKLDGEQPNEEIYLSV